MRRAIKMLPGYNLRQALFAAAGMSDSERYHSLRVFLWATDGTGKNFAACRSMSKHLPLPNPNYALMATFRFGDVETTYYPEGAERELWPDYPWLDSSLAAMALVGCPGLDHEPMEDGNE